MYSFMCQATSLATYPRVSRSIKSPGNTDKMKNQRSNSGQSSVHKNYNESSRRSSMTSFLLKTSQTLPDLTTMQKWHGQLICTLQSHRSSTTTIENATLCRFFLVATHLMTQCPAIPPQICDKLVNVRDAI